MTKIQRTFIWSKYTSLLFSGTVTMVLTAITGLVDTLVAGIILGEDAVAGICLVLPVWSIATFFAVCLSYGVPVLYDKHLGAFRKEQADRYFGVGLTVVLSVGLLLFFLAHFGGEAYLKIFEFGGRAYENAGEYLSWMKFAVMLLPLNELLDGMLFADGDEKLSLAANLVRGILKIVLSVILCRTMGIRGLNAATLISVAASLLISCLHFFRPGNTLRLNLAFSCRVFRDILKFGFVDGSTHLFISCFTIAMNIFVIRKFGPEMLVLVSAVTLLRESQFVFEGIGEAITPLVGVYLGEENYAGVRQVWKYAHWSLCFESLFFTAALLAAAPLIVDFLGIGDPAVARYTVHGLRIMSLTLVWTCRMFLDSSYFILIERVRLGIYDSFLRELFPAVPFAVLGAYAGGVPGMFIGLAVAQPVGYLFSILHVRRKYGRENYALFLAEMERRKEVHLFEFRVRPETIVEVRDRIGKMLSGHACPDSQVSRVMLIFEELFMTVYECNPGKKVLAECSVDIGDTIRLTTKDNGRIVDLMRSDRDVSSLRSYTLSSLLETFTTQRHHLLALSYNHNAFEIPREE